MRVGRPAANLYNLRVQSTARTAARLIATSRDPPRTLGSFLAVLVDGLRPAHTPHTDTSRGIRPPHVAGHPVEQEMMTGGAPHQ